MLVHPDFAETFEMRNFGGSLADGLSVASDRLFAFASGQGTIDRQLDRVGNKPHASVAKAEVAAAGVEAGKRTVRGAVYHALTGWGIQRIIRGPQGVKVSDSQ